jgi:sugar lactone lactonase YvrE
MIRTSLFLLAELVLNVILLVSQPEQMPDSSSKATLEEVASFDRFQPTGIAVSKTGRIFVNFPLWSDDYEYAVVEVLKDGSTKPYPNEQWNSWKTKPQQGNGTTVAEGKPVTPSQTFVCVQSVWVDDRDRLWVLDPASPKMERVVPGGPKLVCINLESNQVEKVIPFNDEMAPPRSYLNDVRVDTARKHAYITDSGMGAIVVVNLESGQSKRVLADHSSTKAQAGVTIVVEGVDLRDEKTGDTPQIHVDGLALSKDGDYVYYHALTGKTLYRVPTGALRDESLSETAIAEQVEKVAETVVTDGLLIDDQGRVYHTALEQNAIVRFDPESKTLETVVADGKISWPDSMALGGDSALYFTTSQIHLMPRFNKNENKRVEPYRILRATIQK